MIDAWDDIEIGMCYAHRYNKAGHCWQANYWNQCRRSANNNRTDKIDMNPRNQACACSGCDSSCDRKSDNCNKDYSTTSSESTSYIFSHTISRLIFVWGNCSRNISCTARAPTSTQLGQVGERRDRNLIAPGDVLNALRIGCRESIVSIMLIIHSVKVS